MKLVHMLRSWVPVPPTENQSRVCVLTCITRTTTREYAPAARGLLALCTAVRCEM